MRKKINIIGIALLIIGILFLCFPIIYGEVDRLKVKSIIKNFKEETTKEINLHDELFEEIKKYNEKIYQEKQKNLMDEKSYSNESIDLSKYGINSNMIGYIRIPKIKIELPIYLGANKENLSKGATHLTETSIPIGGKNTNSVIAAHRNRYGAASFFDIDKLSAGDTIYIENYWGTLEYQVIGYEIVESDNISVLYIKDEVDMITLSSCHPPKDSRRYVVYAKRFN